jgi:shikimate 5-dehydrogenase
MTAPAMGFIGVDTGHSAIRSVFPIWARELGLPTEELRGHDVPLGADPQTYRDLVAAIRDDDSHLGALVTTHKVALFDAAADLFDDLDGFSTQCGEISSIYKRDGRLCGAAKDPVTAGLALSEFVPHGHFARTGAELLCLGAGGAGTAITTYLAQSADVPARIVVTDVDATGLARLEEVHRRAGVVPGLVRYEHVAGAEQSTTLLAAAPPGSLVVNASGLGKDRPGSPVADDAVFPERALVWEINYRGSLELWHQARMQAEQRSLVLVDGWRYFIHGWTQVIADVFHLPLPAATVDRLASLAEAVR